MNRKVLSVLICALMLTALLPAFSFADDVVVVSGSAVNIGSADELLAFAQKVNSGEQTDAELVLTSDVTIDGDYTPIGTEENPFCGTFDGCGYTIEAQVECDGFAGVFGCVSGAQIKNLSVAGIFAASGDYAGGVAAQAENTVFEGCETAATVGAENLAGGIAGFAENCEFNSCTADTGAYIVCYGEYAGGIAGKAVDCVISDCVAGAYVEGNAYCGGIAGLSDGEIVSCVTSGTVLSEAEYVGGIAGEASGSITACKNGAAVSALSKAGGIAGFTSEAVITGCANLGDVTVSDDIVGGLCGIIGGGKVENCYNAGDVTAPSGTRFAGIFSSLKDGTVSKCYNVGTVSGACKTYPGIGYSVGGTVEYCYCPDTYNKLFISGSDPVIVSCAALKDMTTAEGFEGFDFENDWSFITGHGYDYPVLGTLDYHTLTYIDTVAPTCVEKGYDDYACSVCGAIVKLNTVDANGHSYETMSYKAATCTEAGYGDYKCSVCNETYSEDYEATGHFDSDDDGKCDVCGEKLTEGEDDGLNIFEKIIKFFKDFFAWIKSLFTK